MRVTTLVLLFICLIGAAICQDEVASQQQQQQAQAQQQQSFFNSSPDADLTHIFADVSEEGKNH
jgi:uncharacterized alpha/beta hydrolase family protein